MSVKVLAAELGEVHRQTQLIIDDPRWRDNLSDMPAELKMKLEALLSKAEELKPKLDLEHELEKKANQVRDLHSYLESPQYKTPRGPINPDSDGRQTMLQAGWEIKSGRSTRRPHSGHTRCTPSGCCSVSRRVRTRSATSARFAPHCNPSTSKSSTSGSPRPSA